MGVIGMFKKKCKQCKVVLAKGQKEFCSEEHKEQWRSENLRPFQKAILDNVEKYASKPGK
jgi:hypothetical protein